jgi:hypothetical protein
MIGPDRVGAALRRRARRARLLARWRLGPDRPSRERVLQMKDLHQGERCFILGNGPSLNRTDLPRLRNEVTFGLNRIYLNFDRMGYATTYLACVNIHVLTQFVDDFRGLEMTRFFSSAAGSLFEQAPGLILVPPTSRSAFATTPQARGIREGGTVTFVALQLAYHLGFEEAVLLGVDHRFSATGPPNKLVTSNGDDRDHFHPSYFGAGVKWQLPDLEASERSYRVARAVFEADGRRIVDATVDGALTVFPKVPFEQVAPAGKAETSPVASDSSLPPPHRP